MTLSHVGRSWTGRAGSAYEVLLDNPEDHPATIGCWFLNCPNQSPYWDNFSLSVVHLRPALNAPMAVITVPKATHEVCLIALDPTRRVTADPDSWIFLHPINVTEQVELPTDELAKQLLESAVRAVIEGVLWAEPPLSGQVEPWHTSMIRTSAHLRGEAHAP